jgi:hypothetical protein
MHKIIAMTLYDFAKVITKKLLGVFTEQNMVENIRGTFL